MTAPGFMTRLQSEFVCVESRAWHRTSQADSSSLQLLQVKSYLAGNPAIRLALNDDLVIGRQVRALGRLLVRLLLHSWGHETWALERSRQRHASPGGSCDASTGHIPICFVH